MHKCVLFTVACGVFSVCLSVLGQEPASVKARQLQGPDGRIVQLDFSALSSDSANQWFLNQGAPAGNFANYSIYLVLHPDTSVVSACDVSHDYLDSTKPPATCTQPDTNVPMLPKSNLPFVDTFEKAVNLPLLKPLEANLRYIVTIHEAGQPDLEIPISNTTSLISPDATKVNTEVKVNATVALEAKLGQVVTVSTPSPKGATSRTVDYSATVHRIDPDGIVLILSRPLQIGATAVQVSVKGLTDYYGTAVSFQGKVQNPTCGVATSNSGSTGSNASQNPTSVSCAFITTKLSAIAAVHSVPTFSATGAIAPWHPATRTREVSEAIFFDPSINFDLGSATAKTSNSVIVPSAFSRAFVLGLPKVKQLGPADLVKLEGTRPMGVNTSFGPRAEFDTLHGGVNLLAEARGELYLPKLSKSIDVQKATFAEGNPAIRDLIALPTTGYLIASYVQFDAGGHLNSQTIANPAGQPSINVPRYDIVRMYLGVSATAQLGRNTFILDGSWVNLFLTETAPFNVNNVVDVRRISSFQPHAIVTYSLYFDQLKHFAGSISWEDGRTAPTWQYLNKVTIGLQVTY